MKFSRLTIVLGFFMVAFSFSDAQAFVDPSKLLEGDSAQKMSDDIGKVADGLQAVIAQGIGKIESLFPKKQVVIGPDGKPLTSNMISFGQLSMMLLLFGLSFLVFSKVRSTLRKSWVGKKNPQKSDVYFSYTFPWAVFFLVSWGLSHIFFMHDALLHLSVVGLSLVLATGMPLYRLTSLTYGLDMNLKPSDFHKALKKAAPPFIYGWVRYLFVLQILVVSITIGLLVLLPTLEVFGHMKILKSLGFNVRYLHFDVQGILYFYMLNFSIFLVALQQRARGTKAVSKTGILGVVERIEGRWFFIAYLSLVGTYACWISTHYGFVSPELVQIMATFNIALLSLLSLPLVHDVFGHTSGAVFSKIISKEIQKIFDTNALGRLFLYAFYLVALCGFLASIWSVEAYFIHLKGAMKALVHKSLFVGIIVGSATFLVKFSRAIIDRVLSSRKGVLQGREHTRFYTLLTILRNLLPLIFWVPAIVLVLIALGVSAKLVFYFFAAIAALIIFVGQEVIQDMIKGFILVMENMIAPGDVVTAGGVTGIIETMNLHSMTIREDDGALHFISYSSAGEVTNMSSQYSVGTVSLDISDASAADKVMGILEEVGQSVCKKHKDVVLSDFEMDGIKNFSSGSVKIEGSFKTRPQEQDDIKAEILEHVRKSLTKEGIAFSYKAD